MHKWHSDVIELDIIFEEIDLLLFWVVLLRILIIKILG
jgi:hypothetical protein